MLLCKYGTKSPDPTPFLPCSIKLHSVIQGKIDQKLVGKIIRPMWLYMPITRRQSISFFKSAELGLFKKCQKWIFYVKIIQIFLKKNCSSGAHFFIKMIFWQLQFWNHLITKNHAQFLISSTDLQKKIKCFVLWLSVPHGTLVLTKISFFHQCSDQ